VQRYRSRNVVYAAILIASAFALAGCPSASLFQTYTNTGPQYPNATISVSPQAATMTPGSSQIFNVSVGNDANTPGWWFPDGVYYPNLNLGTINGQGSPNASVLGTSVQYVAPSTPPIYATNYDPSVQGIVRVGAAVGTNVSSDPEVYGFVAVRILMPQVTAGLSPTTASVALGSTLTLYGYAVGGATNQVTWQVNGITNGNSTVGSFFTSYGLYEAPSTMPMSGNTVTITMTSVADPTKSATCIVTLH